MKKKEIYEELIKELNSHQMNLSWIMRSADDTIDLRKINMFLPHRLVENTNLLELLRNNKDISSKNVEMFAKELKSKILFTKKKTNNKL